MLQLVSKAKSGSDIEPTHLKDVENQVAWNSNMAGKRTTDACELPAGARWCTAVSGDKTWTMAVYSDDADEILSRKICEEGYWEFRTLPEMGVNESFPGELVLLDIGAHIGWYTFMYAAHGHKVIAVEPMTANRNMMKATLCMNPELASRIDVFAAALTTSAQPGQHCNIFSYIHNAGDGILACSESDKEAYRNDTKYIEREEVPMTNLDRVLTGKPALIGPRIDVVKIDVEGHECNVLAGASQLFSKFHPKYLMIESRVETSNVGATFNCVAGNVTSVDQYGIHTNSFTGTEYTQEAAATQLYGTVDLFFTRTDVSLTLADGAHEGLRIERH